jgi:hypothetical protein
MEPDSHKSPNPDKVLKNSPHEKVKEFFMFESARDSLWRTKDFFCSQCWGSGSGWIGIILADPNPDLYPFQPNVKLNYTFPRKFQYTG